MEKSINVARVQCRTCLDELRSYGGRFTYCSCHNSESKYAKGIAIDHTVYYTRFIGFPHDMNHLTDIPRSDVKSWVVHHTELLPGVEDGND